MTQRRSWPIFLGPRDLRHTYSLILWAVHPSLYSPQAAEARS